MFKHLNKILAAGAGLAAVFIAVHFWQESEAESGFAALAAEGEAALSAVETPPDRGRRHLRPGEDFTYFERFPTSGPHAQTWTKPGLYETPQPPNMLVHAAEHGNVIVHYERLGAAHRQLLGDWVALYTGQWDGLVAVRSPGLGEQVVLVAWNKRLTLDRFEPAAVAAFIDAFRGRGPENPVR